MLWYKAWLDTRWRFLIGLGLLSVIALANVLAYPTVQGLLQMALQAHPTGPLAGEINWTARMSGTFRGYVWVQVVRQNLFYSWIVFAVLLGADGPLSQRSGVLFTLALPVSRRRLLAVRVASDLLELGALALFPMLVILASAPAVHQTYSVLDVLVHSTHIFIGGVVFYGAARLLCAVFDDRWRPIMLSLALAVLAGLCAEFVPALAPFSPSSVMSAENYFHTGTPFVARSLLWLALAAAMACAATGSVERRDF